MIKYYCDKCSNEIKDRDTVKVIHFSVSNLPSVIKRNTEFSREYDTTLDLCLDCLRNIEDRLGIVLKGSDEE